MVYYIYATILQTCQVFLLNKTKADRTKEDRTKEDRREEREERECKEAREEVAGKRSQAGPDHIRYVY